MITLEDRIKIAEWAFGKTTKGTRFIAGIGECSENIYSYKVFTIYENPDLFTEASHVEALRQVILSKGYKFELEGYFCKGEPKFGFQIFHNIDLSNDSYHSYDEKECQLKAVLQLINKEKSL